MTTAGEYPVIKSVDELREFQNREVLNEADELLHLGRYHNVCFFDFCFFRHAWIPPHFIRLLVLSRSSMHSTHGPHSTPWH